MKKLMALAMAAVAVAVQAKTSTPEGWTDDYDAALKRAAAEKKLVVADFSGSDWCGWCKKLDQEVFDTDVFRKVATNRYVLLMVDSPQDKGLLSEKAKKQNPELVKKYKIRGFPTVLVLDEKGEVQVQAGYQKGGPKKYLKMLKSEIKNGPDIKKYIKPIEAVLNEHDEAMQKEMMEAMKTIDRKDQKAAQALFSKILPKYIPLYEKAFAKAKEMKVPAHMEAKKNELISRQERNFKMMKDMAARLAAEQKKETAK